LKRSYDNEINCFHLGNSFLRIIGAELEDSTAMDRLKKMRPRPSNYVAWGSASSLTGAYSKAKEMGMIKRDTRWTLVFTDLNSDTFNIGDLEDQTNFLEMKDAENCCIIKNVKDSSK
jgi:hypothetical protein